MWKLREKREDGWYRTSPLTLTPGKDYTAITKSVYHQLRNKKGEDQGFCHRKFKANIVIDTIDSENGRVSEGDFLVSSDGLLKVIKRGKKCYTECPVYEGKPCDFVYDVFFMKAVTKGHLTLKDEAFFV